MRLGKISDEKLTAYETWSRDVVVFEKDLFLEVSSLATRMQKFRMRADATNWLQGQPLEQGMIIYEEKF